MGMFMSFMGKGIPSTQTMRFLMGTLQEQFVKKNINNFDDFHCAILDLFNTINSALPGRHYDVPSPGEVKDGFIKWQSASEAQKKEELVRFMKKNISINRLDDSAMVVGMLTPPAAMAAKRGAENVTQTKVIKAIPDVIFVPSVTVLAVITTKLTRRMFLGSRADGGGAGGNMPEGANGEGKEQPMPAAEGGGSKRLWKLGENY